MADRIEREIEEILERLDNELPGGALPDEKKPISIMQRRQQATQKQAARVPRAPRQNPLKGITPAHLLFLGAGLTVGGFLLSGAFGGLIWLSMAGVILFIAAFIWSLTRTTTAGAEGSSNYQPPKGVFWRDRYIEYDPPNGSVWSRLKRRFRR
ncbi:MAG: hypothetical protein WD557_02145 [Dehalococcoidia bacterium]